MKKNKSAEIKSEYRREDLGIGVRGKYYQGSQEGTNLVLLSPDVAQAFPTDKAVNDALRALMDIAGKTSNRRGTITRSNNSRTSAKHSKVK